jgi:hypothetical protein
VFLKFVVGEDSNSGLGTLEGMYIQTADRPTR